MNPGRGCFPAFLQWGISGSLREESQVSAPSGSSAILSSLLPEGHFFGSDVTFSSKTDPARIHLHSCPGFQHSPLGTVAGNDLAGNSASFPLISHILTGAGNLSPLTWGMEGAFLALTSFL